MQRQIALVDEVLLAEGTQAKERHEANPRLRCESY